MDENRARRIRYACYLAVALYLVIVIYTLSRTSAPLAYNMLRAAGLLGYGALFLAILSHEYMREMRKLFGKPFLTVHHMLAVAGLVLAILHPLILALLMRDPRVFVPRFDSFRIFLSLGGRPALYLIVLAVLAAVLRRRLKDSWKLIHWLNYAAFVLIFAHSWLLGRHASQGVFKFLWPLMLAVVIVVFVRKRLVRTRPK